MIKLLRSTAIQRLQFARFIALFISIVVYTEKGICEAPSSPTSSCQSAKERVDSVCDVVGSSTETIMWLSLMAPGLGGLGGQGLSEQCGMGAKIAAAAAAINAAFSAGCGSAIYACKKECESSISSTARSTPSNPGNIQNYNACQKFERRVQLALRTSVGNAGQYLAGRGCEKAAQAFDGSCSGPKANEIPGCPQFCAQVVNAESPVCKVARVDCTDPQQARLNPICICQSEESKLNNPLCQQIKLRRDDDSNNNFPGYGGLESPYRGGGLGAGSLEDLLGEDQGLNEHLNIDPTKTGAAAKVPLGGGGPAAGGAGNPFGSKSESGGVPEGPFNTDILKGTTGGRGGGGDYGGGGGGGGSFNYSDNKSGKGEADKFDLSKYLPKKDFKRGLAGVASASADGITGPNGPTIWEKVSRRYRVKAPALIP